MLRAHYIARITKLLQTPMVYDPRKVVLQLQGEYRSIINQLLSEEELAAFKDADLARKRNLVHRLMLEEPASVRVPGGSISVFTDRLNRIAHEVYLFWEKHGERLNSALRDLHGFKLATTIASLDTPEFNLNVRRLCVYFDTLAIICPIHEGKDRLESRYGPREEKDTDEIRSKLHIAVSLVTVILTESLLSTDTAMPLLVIVPDTYASREDCEKIDISSGNLVMKQLVGGDVHFITTRPGFDSIVRRYKKDHKFKAVFDELLSNEYADYLPPELRVDGLRAAPFEIKATTFLANVGEATTEFNMLSSCAEATASDPIIVRHKQRIFRSYLEATATKASQQFELGKEHAVVAQGLLAKPMGFLEALSLDDLRIMRAEGMLEKTREALRSERERFRRADYGTMGDAGDQFASRFVEIIEDAAKTHLERDSQLRTDIRKNAVYFAGACAVGAASIALPQTLLMQALGLGYSSIIGGSALEIHSAAKELKAEKKQFLQNPLGILYGAIQRKRA